MTFFPPPSANISKYLNKNAFNVAIETVIIRNLQPNKSLSLSHFLSQRFGVFDVQEGKQRTIYSSTMK